MLLLKSGRHACSQSTCLMLSKVKKPRPDQQYRSAPGNRNHTTFTVFHWNVLASYLGKNTNPWFLHGINLTPEKRKRIFECYYARDEFTKKLKNPGWPSFARDTLTASEMRIIEDVDSRMFAWPKRLEKIKQIVTSHGADVVSLVELDAFEDIQRSLAQQGYAGEFVARPRIISKDGCGIFWKRSEFNLISKSRIVFIDKYRPDPKKDRCALLVILQHRHTDQQVLIASTHLARDVDNEAPRDAIRARQMGELAAHIRTFMLDSRISLYDCPVIVCGDINAGSMAKLTGLVQVSALMSFQASARKLHPFIFATKAVDTRGVTSRTEAREVRVDAILYSTASADAQGMELLNFIEQEKKSIIPNKVVPSDHFPLLAQIGVLSPEARVAKAVRKWWMVVLPSTRRSRSLIERQMLEEDPWITDSQLDPRDLHLAFERVDINNSGILEMDDALASLDKLALLKAFNVQSKKKLLEEQLFCKVESSTAGLSFVDFCAFYFLAHPVCERCANVAFDHIDSSPRNNFVTLEELCHFFQSFEQSPLEGNPAELFEDAKARGLLVDGHGLSRSSFKFLLGARFVETTFEDVALGKSIVARMESARKVMDQIE